MFSTYVLSLFPTFFGLQQKIFSFSFFTLFSSFLYYNSLSFSLKIIVNQKQNIKSTNHFKATKLHCIIQNLINI